MINKLAARFAVAALLLTTGLSFHAKADTAVPVSATPSIAFTLPDNQMTVHQSAGCVPIMVNYADASGLNTSVLTGAYSRSTAYYPPATKSAMTRLYFYVSYYPVGDYPFTATVTDAKGVQTTQTITVHLLP